MRENEKKETPIFLTTSSPRRLVRKSLFSFKLFLFAAFAALGKEKRQWRGSSGGGCKTRFPVYFFLFPDCLLLFLSFPSTLKLWCHVDYLVDYYYLPSMVVVRFPLTRRLSTFRLLIRLMEYQ